MFRVNLYRVTTALFITAICLILFGTLLQREKKFAFLLGGKKIFTSVVLERKIASLEKECADRYENLGREICSLPQGILASGAVSVSSYTHVIKLIEQASASGRELGKARFELAVLPSRLKGEAAFYRATANLSNKDKMIRSEALVFLGDHGGQKALPYLIEMLNDPEIAVLAKQALIKIAVPSDAGKADISKHLTRIPHSVETNKDTQMISDVHPAVPAPESQVINNENPFEKGSHPGKAAEKPVSSSNKQNPEWF